MNQTAKNSYGSSLKFFIVLASCLLFRLIPFRAPNIEPILASAMPMGRAYGAIAAFSFGSLSIILYDIVTGTLGVRTIFTAGAYGLISFGSVIYLKNKKNSAWDYMKFAIFGTLFYDAVTGLVIGPLLFDQPFMSALMGQIPFTAFHLLGNTIFSYALSPGIYNLLVRKKTGALSKESNVPISTILNPKTI